MPVCECACVCAYVRALTCVFVFVCMRACLRACVRACERMSELSYMHAHKVVFIPLPCNVLLRTHTLDSIGDVLI